MSDAPARLLQAFDRQVEWCAAGASPVSARVLALSRRWLGALHHLALLGREPWAALWPPAPEPADEAALMQALARAWHDERPHLARALARAPQTNEVMRSAALLPGLLHVAARLQRPLQLAEIGASAGLNLWCDHFHHAPAGAPWRWGDKTAALTLATEWRGPPPPLRAPLRIERRAGCDAAPVDLLQPGEALRLASFVWADQHERLARLRAAVAAVTPLLGRAGPVQALRAADFVRGQLAQRRRSEAFVLMHSVVWQYIAPDEQVDIAAQMQAAGATATADAPVAWLRFEPPRPQLQVELRCTTWPGGVDERLAEAHPHGAWVHWQPAGPVAASPA